MQEIRAVVFDWAGTMVDFGSRAPMAVFVEAFDHFGVSVSIAEARAPMGLPKRDHIAAMMTAPRIANAWREATGREPDESGIDDLYEVFVPLNEKTAIDHAALIPGVLPVLEACKATGIKVGSTTGYTRSIMAGVLPIAAAQGYQPASLACSDDLEVGRPTAMMMYKTFVDLGVHEPQRVVKIDDTTPGIAEGLAAGCWTIGITDTGNEMGLGCSEYAAADDAFKAQKREIASLKLRAAGAHYLAKSVADILPIMNEISARIAVGERPA